MLPLASPFSHAALTTSKTLSNREIGLTYACAVAGSVTAAVGLKTYVTRRGGSISALMRSAIPFAGVATAHFINVTMMRRAELTQGVAVFDADGTEVGKSTAAGRRSIAQTIFSRVALAFPVMMIPPVIFVGLERASWWRPRLRTPVEIVMIGVLIWVMMPLALGKWPPTARMRLLLMRTPLSLQARGPKSTE